MKARIVRVGNSQALMIPAALMRDYGWSVGSSVEITPMASGIAATSEKAAVSIAKIAARLVRENKDLVIRLAKV